VANTSLVSTTGHGSVSAASKTLQQHRKPGRALRVLFVEDCEPDALILARTLTRGGFVPEWERVESREEMLMALAKGPWDLVLADHSMPQFSAPEALEIVQQHGLDIPFIIVSGHIEEETAVAAMAAGAHDYVMKDRLARLLPAVERELREAEVRRAQRKNEQELQRAHGELETRVERRTADLRAAYHELQSVMGDRRRLEAELLEIAENERRRIGFDLHDDLGQKLTGASLMVKGLEHRLGAEGHSAAAEVGRIHALLEEIILHTHNLAHQFASLDVRGEDLATVLKTLTANVKKMFGIACVLSVKGTVPDLPPNTMLQFHKIAQEAVSNAIKHGKAKQVTITLVNDGNNLTLTVKNDGLPFDQPASAKNRMGLRIMNYRASTIGATFNIQPIEAGGALVTCHCPLRRAPASSRGGRE